MDLHWGMLYRCNYANKFDKTNNTKIMVNKNMIAFGESIL